MTHTQNSYTHTRIYFAQHGSTVIFVPGNKVTRALLERLESTGLNKVQLLEHDLTKYKYYKKPTGLTLENWQMKPQKDPPFNTARKWSKFRRRKTVDDFRRESMDREFDGDSWEKLRREDKEKGSDKFFLPQEMEGAFIKVPEIIFKPDLKLLRGQRPAAEGGLYSRLIEPIKRDLFIGRKKGYEHLGLAPPMPRRELQRIFFLFIQSQIYSYPLADIVFNVTLINVIFNILEYFR